MEKIKFGKVGKTSDNSARGKVNREARDAPGNLDSELGQSRWSASQSDERVKGYSLEIERRRDNASRETAVKAGKPTVRPSIWIALFASSLLLLMVVLIGGNGGTSLGYDTQEILKEYGRYRKSRTSADIPSVEKVSRELTEIERLEKTGHTAEAKNAWQNLVVTAQNDKENPIYRFGLKRLAETK